MTIFITGDTAIYHGMSAGRGDQFIRPGDVVTVMTGNLDKEDDCIVKVASGADALISASDLEWIEGA